MARVGFGGCVAVGLAGGAASVERDAVAVEDDAFAGGGASAAFAGEPFAPSDGAGAGVFAVGLMCTTPSDPASVASVDMTHSPASDCNVPIGLMGTLTSRRKGRNTMTTADRTAEATGTGEYADVNGLHIYYETHGTGRPLVLLHGGLGSGEMFGSVVPLLAAGHQVILPDLQGHGRTADIDRPIDVRLMADDIAALIRHLGLDKPDVVGYSLGGGVSFWTAVKYPEVVNKHVMVSTNIKRSAIYADMLAQQLQVTPEAAEFMKDTPMYQLYDRVAPRPEDFPALLGKMGESMAKDFDFTDEVRGLKVPTLFVAADADMFPPSHAVEVFELLDGGQRDGGWMGEGRPRGGHALAILPGLTHYDIGSSPMLAETVLSFIDAP